MSERKNKKLGLILFLILILAITGSLFFMKKKADQKSLPKVLGATSVDYPVYYPSSEAIGFKYQEGSARQQSGILFYKLEKNGQHISVSQQDMPQSPPDIDHIQGFKKLETFAGNAAVGINNQSPTAILLTNTTLVTLNADKNVPQDVLIRVVQSMNSL